MDRQNFLAAYVEGCRNFDHLDLRSIDLSNTDLNSINLSHSNLDFANLSGTNLSGSNLGYTSLCYADLSYANLSNVILYHTDLREADIMNANLDGVVNLSNQIRTYREHEYTSLYGNGTPLYENTQIYGHVRNYPVRTELQYSLIAPLQETIMPLQEVAIYIVSGENYISRENRISRENWMPSREVKEEEPVKTKDDRDEIDLLMDCIFN